MAVKHFKELIVWQKAMDLVVVVYRLARHFPREELFGLTSQLRRAAVSVPCNIAEGQGRATTRDFLQFLAIARGSLQEVETQMILAVRLGYLHEDQLVEVCKAIAEVGRLLNGLCNSLTAATGS